MMRHNIASSFLLFFALLLAIPATAFGEVISGNLEAYTSVKEVVVARNNNQVTVFEQKRGGKVVTQIGVEGEDYGADVLVADVDCDGFDDFVVGVPGAEVYNRPVGIIEIYANGGVFWPYWETRTALVEAGYVENGGFGTSLRFDGLILHVGSADGSEKAFDYCN